MKRAQQQSSTIEEDDVLALFPKGVFPVVEEVVINILLTEYELVCDDVSECDSVIDNPLEYIVFQAVVLLPHMSTTAFLKQFVPLVKYLPDVVLYKLAESAIPLFANVRELAVTEYNLETYERGLYCSWKFVEEFNIDQVCVSIKPALGWKNLHALTLYSHGGIDARKNEDTQATLNLFRKLTYIRIYNSYSSMKEQVLIEDKDTRDKVLTICCTNLKTLLLYNPPQSILPILYHIPSITKLDVRATVIRDSELLRYPKIKSLRMDGSCSSITSAGLNAIAPTLRKLKLASCVQGVTNLAVSLLTNLESFSIYNSEMNVNQQLSTLTNLKKLYIGCSDRTIPFVLPSSLEELHLGKYAFFPIVDKSLYNLTNLRSLTFNRDIYLSPNAFHRMSSLKSLKIRKATMMNDSIVPYLSSLTSLEVRFVKNVDYFTMAGFAHLTNLTSLNTCCSQWRDVYNF